MSDALPIRIKKLPGGMEVGIEGTRPGAPLDKPLWAVNWFNYRRRWSYETYNLLAFPSLLLSGSLVLFKGHRVAHLEGAGALQRQNLLIVRYPDAASCLDTLLSPYFLSISGFREMGLKDFVFGFTERVDGGEDPPRIPTPKRDGSVYLVHHFQGEAAFLRESLPRLSAMAGGAGAKLFFASLNAGRLAVRGPKLPGLSLPTPLFMDGTVIFHAGRESVARDLAGLPEYRDFRKCTTGDVVSLFARVL